MTKSTIKKSTIKKSIIKKTKNKNKSSNILDFNNLFNINNNSQSSIT